MDAVFPSRKYGSRNKPLFRIPEEWIDECTLFLPHFGLAFSRLGIRRSASLSLSSGHSPINSGGFQKEQAVARAFTPPSLAPSRTTRTSTSLKHQLFVARSIFRNLLRPCLAFADIRNNRSKARARGCLADIIPPRLSTTNHHNFAKKYVMF